MMVSPMILLKVAWILTYSGVICDIKPNHIEAFFDAYLKEYDNGFRGYADVFGVVYTWLEWLEYNINRWLYGSGTEKEVGASETKNTIKIIQHIYKHESDIKSVLALL